jgi:mRNA-degrading endonuclease toxin of MazEF toxin-antitoxin module
VRRGEIWVYRPVLERPGQARLRLIISNDAINSDESLPVVRGIHILDRDPAAC